MLYIEQPAGVGYSYCNSTENPADCEHDDNSMAKDNLEVIIEWYKRFPEW